MKNNKKKGFTLMELLIVIAIIVVLVAIAIPVFGGQLTKAKETTDVANIRAAYAEAQTGLATGEKTLTQAATIMSGVTTQAGTYTVPTVGTATTITVTYKATKIKNGTSDTFSWKLSTTGE